MAMSVSAGAFWLVAWMRYVPGLVMRSVTIACPGSGTRWKALTWLYSSLELTAA
jgi:hypothetical protein